MPNPSAANRRRALTLAALAALSMLVIPVSSLADDMTGETFSDYALSPALGADATYTVELLIDKIGRHFDPNYWDGWSKRSDAREAPDYKPQFSKDYLGPAGKELKELSWLSFQRIGDARPVRDLNALRFLPEISGLVLTNNEVTDISPLGDCVKLKRLTLRENPIRDISPLAGCANIEELDLSETPIEDFSVLATLPKLREIIISGGQIPAFRRLKQLPNLRNLALQSLDEPIDFLAGFPQMPELRVIRGAKVKSLEGLGGFPKLENLVNLSGPFVSLEPLSGLKALTHINIYGSQVQSLEPLAGLPSLRCLFVGTEAAALDLGSLESLPALHEVNARCNEKEPPSLAKLRATLPSWDIEFRAPKPRHSPALKVEVVDQKTFDRYDDKEPFNRNPDANAGLLGAELDWLDSQLEKVIPGKFEEDEDYAIPFAST